MELLSRLLGFFLRTFIGWLPCLLLFGLPTFFKLLNQLLLSIWFVNFTSLSTGCFIHSCFLSPFKLIISLRNSHLFFSSTAWTLRQFICHFESCFLGFWPWVGFKEILQLLLLHISIISLFRKQLIPLSLLLTLYILRSEWSLCILWNWWDLGSLSW